MPIDNVQANEASQSRVIEDFDDAQDAILSRWEDAETPSENEDLEATDEPREEETLEDESDENQDETDDQRDETDDDDADPEDENEDQAADDDNEDEVELSIDDTTEIEIVVDGKVERASVKDLKRLYGQEASLTRKSQELATTRKQAETALQKADASYRTLLERAQARFKPYSEVDMLVASRQMEPEEFGKLRQEARDAEQDLKFLTEESDAFYRDASDQQKVLHQKAAKDCIQVLQQEMPEWSNDLYNDIRNYAVQSGLPSEQVDQYVDPQVIMLLNKARLYDQSKATADTKKAKAKVIKTKEGNKSKRVLSSKKAPPNDTGRNTRRAEKANQLLRANGGADADDIAMALLARWEQ
jgi:hypothetical protein